MLVGNGAEQRKNTNLVGSLDSSLSGETSNEMTTASEFCLVSFTLRKKGCIFFHLSRIKKAWKKKKRKKTSWKKC